MDPIRGKAYRGCLAALALATSLPTMAQVITARPLTMTRPTALAPAAAQPQLTTEQREWLAGQMRRDPGLEPARLGAAARQRFPDLSEASLDYMIQVAAKLVEGDHREQQRQHQAQLAALEAEKRALQDRVEQERQDVADTDTASAAQKQAAHEAYLKSQSLRMPVLRTDATPGSAKLLSPGQLDEPAHPPGATGDSIDRLSPSLRAWVKSQARAVLDSPADPDPNLIAGNVRTRLAGQDFSDADIEAIAYLVMMEAAKAAQDDMRDIMEQMKAQNERKAAMRDAMQAQRAAAAQNQAATRPELKAICLDPPCKPQLAAEVSRAAEQKDSMSEMGEMQNMRLQMAMDRRSKFFETLSNLLKKYADTTSTITSNLK